MMTQQRKIFMPRGSGLIVVMIIMSFLMAVGVVLLTITGSGPKIAGNIRQYQEAFNAAEAGFDESWVAIENSFAGGQWTSFDGQYLNTPAGIDLPDQPNYFRRLSDEQLLNLIDPEVDGTPNLGNILFCNQPFIHLGGGQLDPRFTFTAFLMDDQAGSGTTNPRDAMLVLIGCVRAGTTIVSTARLEIVLTIQQSGTTP